MFLMCSTIRICAILMAVHAEPVLAWPQQFDLVCVTRGRVAADPHPRSRGTYPAGLRRWRSTSRLIVDLRTRRYCMEVRCVDWGASRIAAMNNREFSWLTLRTRRTSTMR